MAGVRMTCYAAHLDLGPCDSARQRHHVIKKQRIRKAWRTLRSDYRRGTGPKPWSISKALADERNLVVTCYRHHREEDGAMPIPDGFWDFVAEYDLERHLPRYLAERTEGAVR